AGPALELALTVFLHWQRAADLLAQLRGHDLVDIREGDGGGIARDEGELFRATLPAERPGGEPDVIGDQPGTQADPEHRKRNNHEIPGPRGHRQSLKRVIRIEVPIVHCSSTYSRCSTARPASQSVIATMAPRHTRLTHTD